MGMQGDVQPQSMSLPDFRQLLERISPDELRQLPVESLPEEIPLELVESARDELKPILEDLSLAVGTRHLQRWGGDRQRFGEKAALALEEADRPHSHELADLFRQAVQDLAGQWRDRHNDFGTRLQRLDSGRMRLAQEVEHVERALATYYGLNLAIARSEMRAKREEIDSRQFEDRQIQERIDTLHEKLEKSQGAWRRKLQPGAA